jgi:hypothetical protein
LDFNGLEWTASTDRLGHVLFSYRSRLDDGTLLSSSDGLLLSLSLATIVDEGVQYQIWFVMLYYNRAS